MALFRKLTVVVEATQWFKNGDHPLDYAEDETGFENGELRIFTGEERKEKGWQGSIVRYFRRPDIPGSRWCQHCGKEMNGHGWIDTKEGGHIVCPGDYIITGVKGEHYPCKPDIFSETYDSVEGNRRRPTIAELEEILNKPEGTYRIVVNPDGSVSAEEK